MCLFFPIKKKNTPHLLRGVTLVLTFEPNFRQHYGTIDIEMNCDGIPQLMNITYGYFLSGVMITLQSGQKWDSMEKPSSIPLQ